VTGDRVSRSLLARLLRLLLVAGWTAAVFGVVVVVAEPVVWAGQRLLLPFVAACIAAVGMVVAREPVDRFVRRVTHYRLTTPYSVLAQTTARVGAGSLEQALPGLAQVLAEGTGAQRATVWLVVEGRLVEAASFPPDEMLPDAVDNLGVLLARPDTDFVVPVLDGTVLRAALAIDKPDGPVTAPDRRLMQDVADGAGLLLRSVARGAELHERVRRADELADELRESRRRLTRAREVERRRLVGELSHVTTGRLATLRAALRAASVDLHATPARARAAADDLGRARTALDELLERFRVIARGVYPAVLRDQGPAAALDEVLADLPRTVRLTGDAAQRLGWEVESGIYYLAAAAVTHLAGRPAHTELHVHLEHGDGRFAVRIEDPALGPGSAAALRTELAGDVERLAALGGAVDITEYATGVTVLAWLPDRLEPLVGAGTAV
jgi:signal transduction histidine kinase